MSVPSISEMVGRLQAGRQNLLTQRYLVPTFRNIGHLPGRAGYARTVGQHAHFAARFVTRSVGVASPETTRILLVCLAILVAVIVGMGTAYLSKSDGQTVPSAILKAGAAFAGAVTILILLMNAAGLI